MSRYRRVLTISIFTSAVCGIGLTLYHYKNHDGMLSISADKMNLHTSHYDAINWIPPSRDQLTTSLKSSSPNAPFDLLIIGGGATGTGCALDAVSRGLKVACVERDDFSSGTSSRSTKLVHGGVRYLEKAIKELDFEQYRLVREALSERATFLKIAPYLTVHLPIMIPVYKWYQIPYFWAGAKLYDMLSGGEALESSYYLSKSKALEVFPMLKPDSLAGAVVYYDGQHNDSRMNVALALTAIQQGATVLNHMEVVKLLANDQGKICGATVLDHETKSQWNIYAKGVINATGPFADNILQMTFDSSLKETQKKMVIPSAGVHIVLPSYFSPRNMGLIDPHTSDGRVIFFLPWEGSTIAGTTDSPSDLSYNPTPSERDINFIVDEVSDYLADDIRVRRSDILSAWAGIRPLVIDPSRHDGKTESLVRNHLVYCSPSGLLTIVGGKWTTYRNMAQDAIDKAIQMFGLKSSPCVTKKLLLHGSHGYSDTLYLSLIQKFGFDPEVAKHLTSSYGDRAIMIANMSELTDHRWPIHGKRLITSYPYTEDEVRYAVRHEYALTAVDILARRTRLAFLNAQAAREALPQVIRIMSKELGWSSERQASEFIEGKMFLKTMGLASDIPFGAIFSKRKLAEVRNEFSSFDKNDTGYISKNDVPAVMKNLNMSTKKLQEAMEKIGLEFVQGNERVVDFGTLLSIIDELTPSKASLLEGSSAEGVLHGEYIQDTVGISTERSGGGI